MVIQATFRMQLIGHRQRLNVDLLLINEVFYSPLVRSWRLVSLPCSRKIA